MNVLILNGSSKKGDGASNRICQALARIFEGHSGCQAALADSSGLEVDGFLKALGGCQALVVVAPLYINGLPSHLLGLLEGVCGKVRGGLWLYAVINCGFWEPEGNVIALKMLKSFCLQSGLEWGQGLAWGGGGLLPLGPRIGRFPFGGLFKELVRLTENIAGPAPGPDRFAVPQVPRFLYKAGANIMWRWLAFKNKVKQRDLRKRLDV
jgi:hypothetical protein